MKKLFTSIVAASIISIVIQSDVNAQSDRVSEDMLVAMDTKVSVFPNPAIDFVEFNITPDADIVEIQIFDMIGNKVFSQDIINQPKYILERRELKNGMYIYSVKDANGKTYTGRITLK